MKKLMMFLLLVVLILSLSYTVFPKELEKILYEHNGLIGLMGLLTGILLIKTLIHTVMHFSI